MKADPKRFFQMRDGDGSLAESLDELRSRERPVVSRAEIVRRLVQEKLAASKKSSPKRKIPLV